MRADTVVASEHGLHQACQVLDSLPPPSSHRCFENLPHSALGPQQQSRDGGGGVLLHNLGSIFQQSNCEPPKGVKPLGCDREVPEKIGIGGYGRKGWSLWERRHHHLRRHSKTDRTLGRDHPLAKATCPSCPGSPPSPYPHKLLILPSTQLGSMPSGLGQASVFLSLSFTCQSPERGFDFLAVAVGPHPLPIAYWTRTGHSTQGDHNSWTLAEQLDPTLYLLCGQDRDKALDQTEWGSIELGQRGRGCLCYLLPPFLSHP